MADLRASGLGGVPKGTTADRPSSPSIGDVFYNGTLGCLEIYTSGGWYASSAPMAIPTIGTAVDIGNGRSYSTTGGAATVAFTQNTGGGLPNSFTATSNPGGISGSSTSSPITVTGLTPGTAYTFTVTGTNNFGTSAASLSSNSINATTVPQAPSIGTATQSFSDISLTFTAGATGGLPITNYKYSVDGINYIALSPAQTSSPLTIPASGLTVGQSFQIYIKAVNSNGDSAASSATSLTLNKSLSGGILTSDSTYYYRTFTGSGMLSTFGSPSADILLIGGGGAGGGINNGGGGGAGGVVYASNTSLSLSSYSITAGGGGPGANSSGASGTSSTFGSLFTANGGGGGGGGDNADSGTFGKVGGSGGGNSYSNNAAGGLSNQTSGSGYTGYGNNGAAGYSSTPFNGGGGGGAGTAGSYSTSAGGNGGNGLNTWSSWLPVSALGQSGYIAGGGAAGSNNTGGSGGLGGGGNGANPNNATSGAASTGSGGGGCQSSRTTGGSGGSGIIIVRYTKASVGG